MLLALLGLAAAQDTDLPDNVIIPAVQELEFEYVRVDGKLVGPNGVVVVERPKAEFNPMIKLRTDFHAEMDNSVDSIR